VSSLAVAVADTFRACLPLCACVASTVTVPLFLWIENGALGSVPSAICSKSSQIVRPSHGSLADPPLPAAPPVPALPAALLVPPLLVPALLGAPDMPADASPPLALAPAWLVLPAVLTLPPLLVLGCDVELLQCSDANAHASVTASEMLRIAPEYAGRSGNESVTSDGGKLRFQCALRAGVCDSTDFILPALRKRLYSRVVARRSRHGMFGLGLMVTRRGARRPSLRRRARLSLIKPAPCRARLEWV